MPRRKKDSNNGEAAPAPSNGAGNGSTEQQPIAPPKKKSVPRRKVIARKKAPNPVDSPSTITDEAIRSRAYFIAEERARRGLPGDEHSDWQEARRQLVAELG